MVRIAAWFSNGICVIKRLTCCRAGRVGRKLQAKRADRCSDALNSSRVMAIEALKGHACDVCTLYHFEWALVALACVALAPDDRTRLVHFILMDHFNLGLLV